MNPLNDAIAALAAEAAGMLADEKNGDAPTGATRRLTPEERAARVKFGQIQADLDAAEHKLATIIEDLQTKLGAGLTALIFGGADEISAPQIMANLNAAALTLPPALVAHVKDAAEQITATAQHIEELGAEHVQAEAKRQGAKPQHKPPAPYPATRWAAAASIAALAAWERITTVLRRDIITPQQIAAAAPFTRPQLTASITEIKLDGALDLARQTILQAHGTGRDRAATSYKISETFASEIMDGNTCTPCRNIDRHTFKTFTEAREAYPFGGYKACNGGLRCRGTLVYVMNENGTTPPPPPPWEPDQWATLTDLIPQ